MLLILKMIFIIYETIMWFYITFLHFYILLSFLFTVEQIKMVRKRIHFYFRNVLSEIGSINGSDRVPKFKRSNCICWDNTNFSFSHIKHDTVNRYVKIYWIFIISLHNNNQTWSNSFKAIIYWGHHLGYIYEKYEMYVI